MQIDDLLERLDFRAFWGLKDDRTIVLFPARRMGRCCGKASCYAATRKRAYHPNL
ncbi:MAG: hypothetical protein KKB37_07285 [Alphaproteobacteria bacterium]|nr:hypothetical protein [Alphaproteobacteria bacterium]